MILSERAAAALLCSVGMPREQARLLLGTGVAGVGQRVGAATAYADGRVRELVNADEATPARTCPHGLYISRLSRDRSVDVTQPWRVQAADVEMQPSLPRSIDLLLGVRLRMTGWLPWIVTVSGYVVFGAETTTWRGGQDGSIVFNLRPPGEWFEAAERRWFPFGRGRHWFFWDPWRLQQ